MEKFEKFSNKSGWAERCKHKAWHAESADQHVTAAAAAIAPVSTKLICIFFWFTFLLHTHSVHAFERDGPGFFSFDCFVRCFLQFALSSVSSIEIRLYGYVRVFRNRCSFSFFLSLSPDHLTFRTNTLDAIAIDKWLISRAWMMILSKNRNRIWFYFDWIKIGISETPFEGDKNTINSHWCPRASLTGNFVSEYTLY